jgi:SAM-dependent methyltransferase
MSTFVFENDGYCPCCRSETTFRAYKDWLRDFYVCKRCGSIPRQRHLQAVLDAKYPNWVELAVHESSPSNDYLSRYALDYTASQYFDDVPRGETRNGVRSENIEELTFADEAIDIFVTQDVMEHVFHPDRAIAEIHRVLKPGGAHIFTTPKHRGLDLSVQRASISEQGEITHLLEASWHGNPIGERALVTFDFGYDFEQLVSKWSGASVEAIHTLDRSRGIDAEHNEVFVVVKPLDGSALRSTMWQRAEGVTSRVRRDVALARKHLASDGAGAVARLAAGRVRKLTSKASDD